MVAHNLLVTWCFELSQPQGVTSRLNTISNLSHTPQSCVLIPVEGLLEVYEDMVGVLLVLGEGGQHTKRHQKVRMRGSFLQQDSPYSHYQ